MPVGADAAALGVGAPLILSSLNIKDLHLQPRAEPPQKWGVGAAAVQNLLIINILQ